MKHIVEDDGDPGGGRQIGGGEVAISHEVPVERPEEDSGEEQVEVFAPSAEVTAHISFRDGIEERAASLQLVTSSGEKTYTGVRNLSLMSTKAVLGDVSGLEDMETIQISIQDSLSGAMVPLDNEKVLDQCIRRHRYGAVSRMEERLMAARKQLQSQLCSRYRGDTVDDGELLAALKGFYRILSAVSLSLRKFVGEGRQAVRSLT